MRTLHLICGLPGAGKSTLSKQLEAETGAVRLTPDEWMTRLMIDGYDERARAEIEEIQWELAQRLLEIGVDVVLEFGFWSRAERMRFKTRATQLGAHTRIHFLDVPREELARRLELRNAALPRHAVPVNLQDIDRWMGQFEAPNQEELK